MFLSQAVSAEKHLTLIVVFPTPSRVSHTQQGSTIAPDAVRGFDGDITSITFISVTRLQLKAHTLCSWYHKHMAAYRNVCGTLMP